MARLLNTKFLIGVKLDCAGSGYAIAQEIYALIRQAYGFRDLFYLKLKIFQLPSIQLQKEL